MLPIVRIASNYNSGSGPVSSAPGTGSVSGAASPTGPAGFTDSDSDSDGVQLSHLSSVLNGLASGATSTLQRIAALTPLVRAGIYQVPSQSVASRLVSDALGAG